MTRVFGGAFAIIYCLRNLHVSLSISNFLMLIGALTGSFFTYEGVFLFTSGLTFFTISGIDWIYIFTNASYQVTRFPMEYMPKAFKYMFTFIMPILVISYYPASAICG